MLWSEITRLTFQGLSSLVARDFNCIVGSHEMGGRQYTNSIESREFRDFIDSAGLIDLGYFGSWFIWCNNHLRPARVWKRIDRILVMAGWLQHFLRYQVQHFSRIVSDQCPILIITDGPCMPRPPF